MAGRWSAGGREAIPTGGGLGRPSIRTLRSRRESTAGRRYPTRRGGAGGGPALSVAAAAVAPILYFVFVYRFATNSFYGDDWSVAPMVRNSLDGRLSLSELWGQYNESRLVVGNVTDIIFGHIDQLDLRSVILFSATLFIVSYALLLALFRRYLDRPLTPIPTLLVGLVWFSLADVENSLWAFQVSWYLTVAFLVLMLFSLNVPRRHPSLWFAVAALAACAASLSTIQGFLCWPLGALCLLWNPSGARRSSSKTFAWLGAMIVIGVVYFRGYDFNNNGCFPSSAAAHPLRRCTTRRPASGCSSDCWEM